MKKKAVAMVLSIALLMCIFPVPASASETGNHTVTESYITEALSVLSAMNSERAFVIENRSTLKGFSGEDEYILLTFTNKGYAIISMQTERIVEAMPDGINPYQACKGTPYYAGPFNYLYKNASGMFYSVRSGEVVSNEAIQSMTENVNNALQRSGESKTASTYSSRASYPASAIVDDSDYIIDEMPLGNNVNDTCGSVAAGMMLTYIDCKVLTPGTVVPASIGYGEPLHTALTAYCERSNGSTSASVSSGINDWLSDNETTYGVDKILTAHYFYVAWGSYAKTSIADNRPVVLALGTVLGSPYGNHQVMAYGYYSNANGDYYNIHSGYLSDGSSSAIMDSSWGIGVCYVD